MRTLKPSSPAAARVGWYKSFRKQLEEQVESTQAFRLTNATL
jgi:hypothetical protein